MGRCNLHLVGNFRGTGIEGPTEHSRKCECIVDLVRIVAPPRTHDSRTGLPCLVRIYFRYRVGHGKDDRVIIHRFNHLPGEDPGPGNADKNVCPGNRIGNRSRPLLGIRLVRKNKLVLVVVQSFFSRGG